MSGHFGNHFHNGTLRARSSSQIFMLLILTIRHVWRLFIAPAPASTWTIPFIIHFASRISRFKTAQSQKKARITKLDEYHNLFQASLLTYLVLVCKHFLKSVKLVLSIWAYFTSVCNSSSVTTFPSGMQRHIRLSSWSTSLCIWPLREILMRTRPEVLYPAGFSGKCMRYLFSFSQQLSVTWESLQPYKE